MAKNKGTIKIEIEAFKTENGGDYPDYYIGITKHIEQRLIENNEAINEHLEKGEYTKDAPIYTAECHNRDDSVEIEQYFQKKGMLKYNPRSHGVKESRYIYCYKMDEGNKKVIISENSSEGKKMGKRIMDYKNFDKPQ